MLAADLGIAVEQEIEYLQRQPDVGRLNAALTQDETRFGGLFVEYQPAYQITVLAEVGHEKEISQAVLALAPELNQYVKVVGTGLTQNALLDARELVLEASADLVTSLSSDLSKGIVVITGVNQEDVDEISAKVSTLELPIPRDNVIVEIGGAIDDVDSYGGLNLDSGSGTCTTGFSVSQIDGGVDGVATAAHCPNNSSLNGVDLSSSFVDGMWGGIHDVQWYKTPGMDDVNKVKDASGTRQITSRASNTALFNGFNVCHYGRTTTYGCGIVIDPTYQPGCGDGHCYDATFARVGFDHTSGGDSGGPWFISQKAVGVHKGHAFNGDPYFMPQNFMNDLGIRPKVNP
jgi:hypothetical protein